MTTDFDSVDYFTDPSLVPDPHPYFDHLRAKGATCCPINNGVLAVTGWEAANAVYKDTENYSSCVAVAGPFTPIPFVPEGDDITAQLEEHRTAIPMYEHMVTMDPPYHTDARSLLSRLLTPKRLKENEDFMWRYADRLLDGFVGTGRCELVSAYAEPFTLTVIADLEGVPEADHELFRERLSTAHEQMEHKPLEFLYERFSEYIEARRADPGNDILSGLATASFPDGSTPEVKDAALLAANLFAGGQETTVRMISFALRMLGERPDLQAQLREDRDLIPTFVEETLRLESPLRTQFRMTRVRTELAGVDIPAGGTVMLVPGACNRDPRVFDRPHDFDLGRPNARQHIAFGHGIHTCAGAPLARAEGRVTVNRFLDRTTSIAIDEAVHGPSGDRRYEYLKTFFLRGLQELHLTLT